MKLIHKNFIYNNLIGFIGLIVPILIFPYLSRTLGPNGIGTVSFAVSLSGIFTLIGSLGLPIYGVREIAKVKNDKEKLSKVFLELLIIQILWMILTFIFYYFWLSYSGTFLESNLFKFLSFIHIFSVLFMFNWFFQGIEDYKIITLINVSTKILLIGFLFFFVKNPNDYWIYYLLIVGTTFVGALISVFFLLSLLKKKSYEINLKKHLKPVFILFSTQLAVGIYVNLDIVFLKYFSNDYEVGIYTPASKLIKVILIIVTSLGTVLIPKLSLNIKEGNIKESKEIIKKSLCFIFIISFPFSFFLFCLSKEIIFIFAGSEFSKSAIILILLAPLLFLIGLSNIFGLQILVPANQEKKLMLSVVLAAILSIVLNYLLIPELKSKGAAYSIIFTELFITILTFYFARKEMKFEFPYKNILLYFFLSILIFPVAFFLKNIFSGFSYLFITFLVSTFIYVSGLFLTKDLFFINSIWKPILNSKK